MTTYIGHASDANFADLVKLGGFPDDEADGVMYVSPSGNNSNSGASPRAPRKTLESAVVKAGTSWRGRLMLAKGTHEVGDGVDLSAYRAQIHGSGPDTIIKASSQSGAVLKFGSSLAAGSALGVPSIGDFNIEGSDATGTDNHGLELSGASGVTFRNIGITKTGGTPLKIANTWGSVFDAITLGQPVSANANDVPYLYANGFTNGNQFRSIGFRSISTDAEGASGVIVFEADDEFCPTLNHLWGFWFEFQHIPADGCFLSLAGNTNIVDAWRFFDCSKASGATGTAWVRLLVPAHGGSYGGNEIRGYIPGDSGSALSVDTGVSVTQSRNSIIGTKGYNGKNVTLESGCDYTTVILGGGESGVAGTAAVIDNSGSTHNTIIDLMSGSMQLFNAVLATVANSKMRISGPNGGASGQLQLGAAGPMLLNSTAAPNRLYVRADSGVTVQAADGTHSALVTTTDGTGPAVAATSMASTQSAFVAKANASQSPSIPVSDVQASDGTSLMSVLPSGRVKSAEKVIAASGIGVGNTEAPATVGDVAKLMPVYDADGTELGVVPIYARADT